MKFRKKPVVIEAARCRDLVANRDWSALPSWIRKSYDEGGIVFASDHIAITTLEGTMRADMDDWIIRGVKGELYPCKPDIFAATYEAVP